MRFWQSFNVLDYTFSIKFTTEKVVSFSILAAKKPDKDTYGITSRCLEGKQVLLFDFDGLTQEEVEDEIIFLQGYYKLSNFYIFQNDMQNSFHAICLDKFPLFEAIEIIHNCSADKGFKKAPILFRQRRWVLRVAMKGTRAKPEFLKVLKSKFNIHQKSTPHRLFINYNYSAKIRRQKNEDGFEPYGEIFKKNTGICKYNTASKC